MRYGVGRKYEPPACVHRGRATGEHVTLTCRTGEKTHETPLAVVSCAIFAECLPDYRCDKSSVSEQLSRDVAVCQGCDRRLPP